jgi:transcriptional regulator with GAF, ATPase, and Fis domain
MVSQKQFRMDLYYRLNVFPVELPPLRERRQDIPQLVSHFVEIFSRRMGKQINHIPQETVEAFTAYSWPGNVRELQNLIERALIRADNGVLPNPLRKPDARPVAPTPAPVAPTPAPGTFWDSQRDLILEALRATGWVVRGPRGAAARLGLKRTSLITKMKKLGISRPVRENDVDELNDDSEREQWWRPAAG